MNREAFRAVAEDGDGAELRDSRVHQVGPQAVLLSRPAQGLSDQPVRPADVAEGLAGDSAIPRAAFEPKQVGIIRAHLEEDAGKSLHDEAAGKADTRIDLNRTGTPLLEIVSAPDMRSTEETRAYLTELKLLLTYLGVSDCNMQEGSLRVDANVNLHIHTPQGKDRHADRRDQEPQQLPVHRAGPGLRSEAAVRSLAGDGPHDRATCPSRPAAGTTRRASRSASARRKNRATTAISPIRTCARSSRRRPKSSRSAAAWPSCRAAIRQRLEADATASRPTTAT